MTERLVIQGAREHNLRNVDLELPRDKLIVFTGLSGSGKSRWPSTPSTPRASGATSSRCPRTPASSSGRWTSPTSTSSRAVAGHLHRPEERQPQPSFHGGHHHRGLRLPPLVVRPDRHSPRPRNRRAAGAPDATADRRSGVGPRRGTRFQVLAPVVRGRKGTYDTLVTDLASRGSFGLGSTAR